MPAKWQRVAIDIPEDFTPSERRAIAQDIIDHIVERVQGKNLDRRNKPLPGYSASYVKSLDFKIAGKSKGDVNLTLSGDMLGAMTLLSHKPGKLLIGFENGTQENAKADGNIRGTYGSSKPKGPKRDFLGLTKKDLDTILLDYSGSDKTSAQAHAAASSVKNPTVTPDNLDDEDDG